MVVVKKKQGESEDRLIARFRKKVLYSGIIIEAREKKSRFKKASEERKEKKIQT